MRVQLPKIGLGCMGFTHAYGELMEEKTGCRTDPGSL